jgi:large subunit ribosomal protein L24
MQKIKKGDDVIVITGKDKGKRGKVKEVTGHRVLVDGVNIVKKHQKPIPARGIEGGIAEKPALIHLSNIAILNPVTAKPDRIGFRVLDDGTKVRVFKSTREVVAELRG